MANVFWGVHSALAASANPTIMMIGDSWFWYPFDNLATEIGGAFGQEVVVVVGYNGAEAAQWSDKYRKVIDFGFKTYGDSVKTLILSGGGNDIAGMSDFLRLLQDNCSKATKPEECFREGQPDAILARISGAYKELILRFRAWNPKAPVVTHNYDKAWPTGKGVFGPSDWLDAPMAKAKVPKAFRRDVFAGLIDSLRTSQLELQKDKKVGDIRVLKTAGTMPDSNNNIEQWWANELHPTPAGFKLLSKKVFVPELKKIL